MRRLLILIAALAMVTGAGAESRWIMCGDYVNLREAPRKKSAAAGFLDTGDEFQTDGTEKNGFVQVIGVGESGDAWVFAGFVSGEKPVKVNARYVCVAKRRAACRRWIDGPRIGGKAGWIYNGTQVKVYYRTDEWSVTSRGYIRSEWLEPDPE